MEPYQFFVHIPATMLPEHLDAVKRLPAGLEILIDHEALAPAFRPKLEALAGELAEMGRPLKFHGPFWDLHPAGKDPQAVALAERRLSEALALAPLFGVSAMVAHTVWDPDGSALEMDAFIERSERFWLPMGERARDAGVQIALENVFDRDPRLLAGLLARLPRAQFGANLDLGHWHVFSRASLGEWFEALGDRLVSLHIHDNRGLADEHLPVGAGSLPWREIFALLARHGRPRQWTLENLGPEDVLRSLTFIAKNSGISEFKALAQTAH